MKATRQFKVAAVSENANAFGLHGHVFIAEDGEAWEVGRNRCSPPERANQWKPGDVVNVPCHNGRPHWHLLGCEIPRELDRAPAEVIAEVWADTDADADAAEARRQESEAGA